MDTTSTHATQRTPAHVEVPEVDLDAGGRAWYLFAVAGVVSGAIGVLVLAYPDPSLKLLGLFLGIDLIAVGVVLIVQGTSSRADDSGSASVMLGTLAVIAGLIVIRNPGHSVALLALAFAIYLIVAGSLALGRGIVHRNGWALVKGAVLVTAGTVIISWPEPSLKTLTVLIGISLVLHGVVEIAEGLALRAVGRAARNA